MLDVSLLFESDDITGMIPVFVSAGSCHNSVHMPQKHVK